MRRTLAAIGLGLALASLPFLRYRLATPHPTAHADHQPRAGGALVMAGDVHLELVRGETTLLLYVSDAYRRPLVDVSAFVETVDGATIPFGRRGDALLAAMVRPEGRLRVTVRLADGSEAGATFDAVEAP